MCIQRASLSLFLSSPPPPTPLAHSRAIRSCVRCGCGQEEEGAGDRLQYTLTQLLGHAEAKRLLSAQVLLVLVLRFKGSG